MYIRKEVIGITIRDSLYFSYAGKRSVDYGIYNVNLNGGMQEESFAASREIVEDAIKTKDKPYFQQIKQSPLKFTVSFAFEEAWDTQKLRNVVTWLTSPSYYEELYFTNDLATGPERLYYALVVDDATLVHNCLSQGYVKLTFRCDSPYAYSPILATDEYIMDSQPAVASVGTAFEGDKQSVIVENESLILVPTRPKWSDYPSGTKWLEL